MFTDINLLIDAEKHISNETMIYRLIGIFGDRLPKDVQQEMREIAKEEKKEFEKCNKKVEKHLK